MQLDLIRLTAEERYIGTTNTHAKIERGGGGEGNTESMSKMNGKNREGRGETRADLEPCLVEHYREDQSHSEIFLGQTRA